MTNGELFIVENPNIGFKLNGSCVWIYLDGVNHYTIPISWWEQEIRLLDKIKTEIMQLDYDTESVDYDYNDMVQTEIIHTIYREEVLEIIDKYRESKDK